MFLPEGVCARREAEEMLSKRPNFLQKDGEKENEFERRKEEEEGKAKLS